MIGKNESVDCVDNEKNNATRIDVISEKKKLLQDTYAKVQEEVRLCFEQLAKVLQTREKQLLRQVRVVHNHQLSVVQSDWKLPPAIPSIKVDLSRRRDIEDSIVNFGELISSDGNGIVVGDAEPYKIEEYVEADKDHIVFDKSITITDDAKTIVTTQTTDIVDDVFDRTSLDISFDANSTLENDITVLENCNYSPPTDDLPKNNDSSELFIPKLDNDPSEQTRSNIETNFSKDDDNESLDRSKQQELKVTYKVFQTNEDNAVAETQRHSTVEESNIFPKETDHPDSSENGNKNLYRSSNCECPTEASDSRNDATATSKKCQDSEQHPKQIQQWLRQILVETETEPTIHEVEQFAEISKSRFKELQFPLET